MIVVKIKKGDKIDKYLKKFKKKFDQVGILKAVKKRMFFEKKSVSQRNQRLKAAYIQRIKLSQEQ